MNLETKPQGTLPPDDITDFAPADYTDGRYPLEWETKYPKEALKKIKVEGIYVATVFVIFMVGIFVVLFFPGVFAAENIGGRNNHWIGCICGWLGGTVGGTLFTIKWLYHSVAKRLWHEDRRLWRFFTPHVSGAIAFFTILLMASGLLKIFNAELIDEPFAVLGVAFLIGYFSDKALAKLAETADTLFGATKKD